MNAIHKIIIKFNSSNKNTRNKIGKQTNVDNIKISLTTNTIYSWQKKAYEQSLGGMDTKKKIKKIEKRNERFKTPSIFTTHFTTPTCGKLTYSRAFVKTLVTNCLPTVALKKNERKQNNNKIYYNNSRVIEWNLPDENLPTHLLR